MNRLYFLFNIKALFDCSSWIGKLSFELDFSKWDYMAPTLESILGNDFETINLWSNIFYGK